MKLNPDEWKANDFDFCVGGVYNHALNLLAAHSADQSAQGVHLDIGCGSGPIAEPLTERLGRTYIGLDASSTVLVSLRERGFEAHQLILDGEASVFASLNAIVAGRRVASISFLNVIACLVDGPATLRAIGRLAAEHGAVVVVSTPNVAHADMGFKLAFGRWDYTESGLLDRAQVHFYDERLFDTTLRQSGLVPIGAMDVERLVSDQAFPIDHPALAAGTVLREKLRELRCSADPWAATCAFVRICEPGPRLEMVTCVVERDAPRPFLSAVIRTQGARPHTFAETLLCLAGQVDDDFEAIVLGHRVPVDLRRKIEGAIEDLPEWMRHRCRLIWVETGNRTRPLNVGFERARGRYIAILDDDDIPMAHWVESFRKLSEEAPGRVLRNAVVRQDVDNVAVDGRTSLRAEGPLERVYPGKFDLLRHIHENLSPPVGLAFPRGAFHDLGIHFDESLTALEDWDYLMRVVAVTGLVCNSEITSVYRWWPRAASSRTQHSKEEWLQNRRQVIAKLDETVFLLPKGMASILAAGAAAGFFEPGGEENDALGGSDALMAAAKADVARYGGNRRLNPNPFSLAISWIRETVLHLRYRSKLKKIAKSGFFNSAWYAYVYPDVVKAGYDPLFHYVAWGGREGRDPGPYFDAQEYVIGNPDIAAAGVEPLLHYLDIGRLEGRLITRSRRTGPDAIKIRNGKIAKKS
jgi:hypothetical protein